MAAIFAVLSQSTIVDSKVSMGKSCSHIPSQPSTPSSGEPKSQRGKMLRNHFLREPLLVFSPIK